MTKTVAALTAVLILGAARHGSAQARNPFVEHADTGEIVHVLPAPAAVRSPRDTAPTMAPAENAPAVYDPSYGSGLLTNHGGPVISNAGFWAIYWNSSVAGSTDTSVNPATTKKWASLQAQMDAFVTSFGSGADYSQAPTDDFSIVQQYSLSGNAISSTVHNFGAYVANERPKATISDSQIRNFITGLFNAGKVDISGNIIYGVYLPSGVKVTMSGGASCSTFCGYHGHFNYGGTDIRYAVFPYLNCSACSLSGLTVADMMTIVASHEIREAVTDPMLNAWFDNAGYEADDKCAWHHLYKTAGGFYVQPEFSNGGVVGGVSYPTPSGCVVP